MTRQFSISNFQFTINSQFSCTKFSFVLSENCVLKNEKLLKNEDWDLSIEAQGARL